MHDFAKKLWLIGCLFGFIISMHGQDLGLRFTHFINGSNYFPASAIMTKDRLGNRYVVGRFSDTTTFNSGASSFTYMSTGFIDMYIQKYNANDSLLWVKRIGGDNSVEPLAIAVDTIGNIYISGEFAQTVDFNPGPGVANRTATIWGNTDVFLLKLNTNGAYLWVRTFGNSWTDSGNGLAIDASGDIILSGNVKDSIDFGFPAGTPKSYSVDHIGFIAKYSKSGTLKWVKTIRGTVPQQFYNSVYPSGLTLGPQGEIFTTGTFDRSVDFNPHPTQTAIRTSNGASDTYILKLDSSGTFQWVQTFGGTASDYPCRSIKTDVFGNVYGSVWFANWMDVDPGTGIQYFTSTGSRDIAYIKLSQTGNLVWAKQIAGSNVKLLRDFDLDSQGNSWLVGQFSNTLDFDPSTSATAFRTSKGSYDAFILKLNTNGNLSRIETLGGPDEEILWHVYTDTAGYVYTAGTYGDSADLNPNVVEQLYNSSSLTPGVVDGFIQKYGACSITTDTLHTSDCVSYLAPDGTILTTTGLHDIYYANALGCDSIYVIDFTLNKSFTTTNVAVCDSFIAPDSTVYFTSGTYTAILQNNLACDSIVTINLSVNNNTTYLTIAACDSFIAADSVVYYQSGQYGATVMNNLGCDSTITYNVTINSPSSNSITATACDAYTAPDGIVYTTSGNYTATIPNSVGCDSVIAINLNVLNTTYDTISPTVCNTYTAPDSSIYTSSGTYTAVLTNQAGCDSVININLTVKNATFNTLNQTVCKFYTDPLGQIITATGTYNYTLTSAVGCDSNLTINLQVLSPDTGVYRGTGFLQSKSAYGTFQWLNCDSGFTPIPGETSSLFVPTHNGNYAVQVNLLGCVDTSACVVVANMGGIENTLANGFSVSPNPVENKLSIEQKVPTAYTVKLLDQKGRVVFQGQYQEVVTALDLSRFAPGVYVLLISSREENYAIKLVKL
jgi:hypothetical protein